jgi:hypothetical protein
VLNGGPYVVRVNTNNGIEREFGWAELIINGKNVEVICENDGHISTILNFNLLVEIPCEYKYLELIQIYLKLGFNSIYAYNFSNITKFKSGCIDYFTRLQKEIIENQSKEK